MPAARAASGGRPRVTVRVISAVWYSRSRSISIRFFATSASIRSVSRSRKAAMARCSSRGGRGRGRSPISEALMAG